MVRRHFPKQALGKRNVHPRHAVSGLGNDDFAGVVRKEHQVHLDGCKSTGHEGCRHVLRIPVHDEVVSLVPDGPVLGNVVQLCELNRKPAHGPVDVLANNLLLKLRNTREEEGP